MLFFMEEISSPPQSYSVQHIYRESIFMLCNTYNIEYTLLEI